LFALSQHSAACADSGSNPDPSRDQHFREYRQRDSADLTAKALQWAKDNPEKHNARGNRYRSGKYSDIVEIFTREEIAECDGWTCSVCELPVHATSRTPTPANLTTSSL
jgi:hypothetical protein